MCPSFSFYNFPDIRLRAFKFICQSISPIFPRNIKFSYFFNFFICKFRNSLFFPSCYTTFIDAISCIFFICAYFEMAWIYTFSVITNMNNNFILRNVSEIYKPRITMGSPTFLKPIFSIARFFNMSFPVPTCFSFLYLFIEFFIHVAFYNITPWCFNYFLQVGRD